jgi:hypothetical protein
MTHSSGSGMYGGTEPNPFSTAGWFALLCICLQVMRASWRCQLRGSLRRLYQCSTTILSGSRDTGRSNGSVLTAAAVAFDRVTCYSTVTPQPNTSRWTFFSYLGSSFPWWPGIRPVSRTHPPHGGQWRRDSDMRWRDSDLLENQTDYDREHK